MAKLLLSCDDYIYLHNGVYYAASQEKYDFYQRYLRIFEQLRLVARYIPETSLKEGRIPLNIDCRIEVASIPVFHGLNEYIKAYLKNDKFLKHVAKDCDTAILRIPSGVSYNVFKSVKKYNLPYAVEVVYDAHDGYKSATSLKSKVISAYIDYYMRRMCYQASGVSCVTEHHLQKRYYSHLQNAFTSHYSSVALPLSFYGKERQHPKVGPFIVSHVANQIQFNGRKGHKELIKAVANLKSKGFIVHVHFAGKDYNNGIEQLMHYAKQNAIEEQVKFLGFISREELDVFLENSNLFVFPTKAEGLPRVIIEAMAKGLPCITTNVSGNPELIDSQFLFEYSDIDSLSSIIEKFIENPDIYEESSKINLKRSYKYNAKLLQERRDVFYKKLKDAAIKCKVSDKRPI